MLTDFEIQAIGFIAVITSILANQQKSDKYLLLLLSLGAAIFSFQFYMLNAYAGSVMCFLGSTRSLLASYYKNKILSYVYCAVYIIAGFFIVHSFLDFVPLIGGILLSVGSFLFEGLYLRINVFFAFTCWLIYSIIIGSWGAATAESLQLISNILGIYRFYIKPNKK